MPNQQSKIGDDPVKVKAPRLGRRSGSSWLNGVCRHVVQPPVAKAHHRNDTNAPRNANESYPSSPNPPVFSGATIVGPTTAIVTHTHTQPRRTIVPKTVTTPLTPAVHQGPTSRRCGYARRRSTPTPGAMHKQHPEPGPSCCVPFGDPHVHKETRSNETRQGYSHSSANTLVPIHHLARTHQIDDKSKERKKKGVHQQRVLSPCLTSCCPCRGGLLRHPDKGNTR